MLLPRQPRERRSSDSALRCRCVRLQVKLVVGLGNPGPEYRNSRHNLGFMALDALAKDLLLEFKLDKDSRSMRTTTFFNNKEDVI